MSALHTRPVPRYRLPAYPLRDAACDDATMLARHLPRTWLRSAELATAASAMLAMHAAGCSDTPPSKTLTAQHKSPLAAIVAPVFQHGTGHLGRRGMLGCIAVAAPVFLSEEEALQVISDELSQAGIILAEHDIALPPVIITGMRPASSLEWITGKTQTTWLEFSEPFCADARDPEHHIVVEFVSHDEYYTLGGRDDSEYAADVGALARSLGELVENTGPPTYFATFYDPYSYYNFARDVEAPAIEEREPWSEIVSTYADYLVRREAAEAPAREAARRKSADLLRLQVRDFIDWLLAQGVI